jgi:hypothetical protein
MTFEQLLPRLKQKGFADFIMDMKEDGTLEKELPEVFALVSTPERLDYHPEGDTFSHTMLALEASDLIEYVIDENEKASLNWCLLCHDLGKALTPKDILPQHIGHEIRGLNVIDSICDRLQVPDSFRKEAIMTCKNHMRFHLTTKMKPAKIYNMIKDITYSFEEPCNIYLIHEVCSSDFKGRGVVSEESNQNVINCNKIIHRAYIEVLKYSEDVYQFKFNGELEKLAFMEGKEQKLIQKISKPIIEYRNSILTKSLTID